MVRTLVNPCWVGKSSTATLRWAARRCVGLPMQTHRLAVVIDKTTCAKIKTTITTNLYSALVLMTIMPDTHSLIIRTVLSRPSETKT
jgi:hypothetical protein